MAGTKKVATRIPKMPKVPGDKKTWTIKLTVPGLVCGIGLAGLALTLFFVLGVLVGRGYRVEENVPRIAAIMPDAEQGQNPEAAEGKDAKVDEVLKLEELTYPETLAKAPAKTSTEEPEKPKADKKEADKKAAKTAQKAKNESAKAEPVSAKPKPGEKVYNYVYQAASFREESMADDLSAKLSEAGLITEVQAGETSKGTWYRVMVLHQGTPDSTNGMKAALKKFGIGKPLMKQKKPVAN